MLFDLPRHGRLTLSACLACQFFLGLMGCGERPQRGEIGHEGKNDGLAGAPSASTGRRSQINASDSPAFVEKVSIPVAVRSSDSLGLTAAASLYTITLSDCESGYGATADESSTNLQVYKFDSGCLAKLTTFTFNGLTYTPTVADPFTSWQAGDEAIYEVAADPSKTLRVKVVSTLGDPVVGTETVEYAISQIRAGTSQEILQNTIGAAQTIPGGVPLPAFAVVAMQLVGETAGEGAQYVFTLECTELLVGDECDGVDLADIRYKLVEDTYGSSLDQAQAQALFAGGSTAIDLGSEKLGAGQGGTTNGGFVTNDDNSILASPDALASHPHMIFILEAEGLSYQYFNIDVSVSIQN